MHPFGQVRTLRAYALLGVVLPLTLVLLVLTGGGVFVYQRVLTLILMERQRQWANVAAISVSEVVDGYARVLEALAGNPDLLDSSRQVRAEVLDSAAEALDVFNAGVAAASPDGRILTYAPKSAAALVEKLPLEDLLRSVEREQAPVFSDLLTDSVNRRDYILVAVPIQSEAGQTAGALVGGVYLESALLSKPISKLRIGQDGFAYLVDQRGRVMYHPLVEEIGADYSRRSFVVQAIHGGVESALIDDTSGQKVFAASIPVAGTGWVLIVQETQQSALAPVHIYNLGLLVAGLIVVLIVFVISWRSVRRLVSPIHLLGQQTARLANGESLEVFSQSGIQEIDALEEAFVRMGQQVVAYRAGLRRYLDAMTQSIEDERRRIARELHDETVQNLLAVSRRLELYRASETDPQRLAGLDELQTVVSDTVKGVRQISRDLRPLILEDLGLVPALQTLLKTAEPGYDAFPQVHFEARGQPGLLSPAQELALYRVAQEALNNIRKHARAGQVWVRIEFAPRWVRLSIQDNGCGFRPPGTLAELTQRSSFGLMGIQERVWSLGGRLEIQSAPDQGTRIEIELPLEK